MARVVGRQPVGEGEADNLVARLFIGGKFAKAKAAQTPQASPGR